MSLSSDHKVCILLVHRVKQTEYELVHTRQVGYIHALIPSFLEPWTALLPLQINCISMGARELFQRRYIIKSSWAVDRSTALKKSPLAVVGIRDPDISAIDRGLWLVTVFVRWDWGECWGLVAAVTDTGAEMVVGNEGGGLDWGWLSQPLTLLVVVVPSVVVNGGGCCGHRC